MGLFVQWSHRLRWKPGCGHLEKATGMGSITGEEELAQFQTPNENHPQIGMVMALGNGSSHRLLRNLARYNGVSSICLVSLPMCAVPNRYQTWVCLKIGPNSIKIHCLNVVYHCFPSCMAIIWRYLEYIWLYHIIPNSQTNCDKSTCVLNTQSYDICIFLFEIYGRIKIAYVMLTSLHGSPQLRLRMQNKNILKPPSRLLLGFLQYANSANNSAIVTNNHQTLTIDAIIWPMTRRNANSQQNKRKYKGH